MSDQHLDNYLRLIVQFLPTTITNLDKTIDNREKHFSNLTVKQREDMLGSSFFFSSNQLRAIADALHTISSLSHISNGSLQVTVTQNGVAGLLREALEAVATYLWLNDYESEEVAKAKAHSYLVIDLQERLNYYKDMGDAENSAKSNGWLNEANQLGLTHGFTHEETNKNGVLFLKPTHSMLAITDLIEKIKAPPTVITTGVLKQYPGMENSKWLYRWSSGLSHGKHWVTNFRTLEDGSTRTVPNYLNLFVLLFTITQELEKIFDKNIEDNE